MGKAQVKLRADRAYIQHSNSVTDSHEASRRHVIDIFTACVAWLARRDDIFKKRKSVGGRRTADVG